MHVLKATVGLLALLIALTLGVPTAGAGVSHTVILASTHGLTMEQIPGHTAKLTATVHIDRIGYNTYIQCYEANIGSDNEYFGIQSAKGTDGKWTAIFSAFDFANPKRVRLYPGATDAFGVNTKGDGTYSSIRLLVKPGKLFVLTIAQTGNGWWLFTVNGHKVGAIQIGTSALQTQGSAWAEFWPNNYNPHPTPPPPVHATVTLKTPVIPGN